MEPIKGDHYRDHKDEVAYTSVNDASKTSFAAVTAPNSHHAARLARLAMMVQGQQKSRESKSRTPALLSSSSPTHPQLEHSVEETRTKPHRASSAEAQRAATIAYSSLANPMPATQILSRHHGSSSYTYWPGEPLTYAPTAPAPMPLFSEVSEQPYSTAQMPAPQPPETRLPAASATRMEFVEGLGYVEVEVQAEECIPNQSEHQVASPMSTRHMAPEVTRYTTDTKMGYKVKGNNGKIEVSAPHASTEAWIFDEFAKLNSKSNQLQEHGIEGRMVKRKHRSSSHSGGSFWNWVTE